MPSEAVDEADPAEEQVDNLSSSMEIINIARKKSGNVILFYSGGKDSIVCLDLLAKKFEKVICVYMYFVKGLRHVTDHLKQQQKKYANVEIFQIPHWNLTNIRKYGLYCNPNPNVKLLKLIDIDQFVRIKTNIVISAYGMKMSDSLNRRLMLKQYEKNGFCIQSNKFYPISTWKDNDILKYIKWNKLIHPFDYGKTKNNGLGFDKQVFLNLQKNYSDDLKIIIKEFPLSESILHAGN